MNNTLISWVRNNPTLALKALGQFFDEKKYCFCVSGVRAESTTLHLSLDTNLFLRSTTRYDIDVDTDLNNTPADIIANYIIIALSASKEIEDDFIEWLKPKFPEEINFDGVPIDKFDAVCAQKLTKKAVELMTSEKEVRELSTKIRKEIKKSAERGEYKCIYYLSKDLSRETIGGAMKDLQASWFSVKVGCAHNCDGNSLTFLKISWEKLDNED